MKRKIERIYLYTSLKNRLYILTEAKKANLSASGFLDNLVTLARTNKLGIKINVSK